MTTNYVVVDGSNIATEGRSLPSLKQLDEAVRAFLTEHPADNLTVVVDATFGHRIDPSERDAYEEAVLAGELVSPPAGAIGRGDAFVLQIADKAGAIILSNDSFQEFHGQYAWLFDEGRLIGGKPVPGLGWVFLLRSPVRGPASRRSVKEASSGRGAGRTNTRSTGGSRRGQSAQGERSGSGSERGGRSERGAKSDGGGRNRKAAPAANSQLNELLPFIDFVGAHPVGTEVEATIDSFSSHGAYARAGDVHCYIPLKSMGDPPPLRARDVVNIGEVRRFTVSSIDAPRRGIDLSLDPSIPPLDVSRALPQGVPIGTVARQVERAANAKDTTDALVTATHSRADHLAEEAPVTPVKKAAAKKAPAKKAPARKAPAKKAVAKKAPARKAVAKKAPARKAPARKTAARKAPARKTAAKKAPARKAPARKAPARKAPARKASAARKR